MKLDLTAELAQLLNFTAKVATAIRMYSAYNPSAATWAHGPHDVMWLSDSLHNFNMLGHAILSGNPNDIIQACDAHLSMFKGYAEVIPTSARQALPTFERHVGRVRLDEAMEVFRAIREKVLPFAHS